MASSESNAIGSVELECLPSGLSIGLLGVGSFQSGYAPGPLTHGTRLCVPYPDISLAHAAGEQVLLHVSSPGFPHSRLTLTRFTAGPGVPPLELRRRRLLLHFGALSLAAVGTIAASVLAPTQATETIAWGALGYGALAALLSLGLGYSLDQRLFLRPPGEVEAREALLRDLSTYIPALRRSDSPVAGPPRLELPRLSGWIPQAAAVVGITVAATVLTALVSGQRILTREQGPRLAQEDAPVTAPVDLPSSAPRTVPAPPTELPPTLDAPPEAMPMVGQQGLSLERRCLCDRADSPLWQKPIPRLSALLIEKRTVPRKTYLRLRLEVAVINNGDSPLEELTLHVQFYERDGDGKKRHTRERPLYFEGPLRPGQAVKWSTEARGTEFEIQTPEFGVLGIDGQGSATADAFAELLLGANHRPVRLHAARMLSYLGDERGRKGALELKDAMQAAEGPYLRRILAATADLRVCDIERTPEGLGACVYNASPEAVATPGLQVSSLDGSLDVTHPLANPPEVVHQQKWRLPRELDAQAGQFVRVTLPGDVLDRTDQPIEVNADSFDLLD